MQVRVVGRAACRSGAAKPEPAAEQLDDALGVVEVVRPGRPVPGAAARPAPVSAKPEPPPLVGRRIAGRAVALADLEDRDVVAAVAQVGRDDLEQAADEALAQDRVLARQRVGDDDRPAGRVAAPARRRARRRRAAGNRSTDPRRDERERHDLGQAGPGERLADGVADLERVGPVGRHRRVRQGRRDELVAADADDLLGDVGLDREVAPPGRDGRVDDLVVAGRSTSSGLVPGGDRDPRARRPRAPSRSRRGPAARAARRRRGRCPSRRLTRAGRNATCAGGGLDRVRVDRARRDLAAGPLGDEPGRPVRADPRQARTPGPSRSAGSPPSAGRSGRPSGGC